MFNDIFMFSLVYFNVKIYSCLFYFKKYISICIFIDGYNN